MLVREGLITDLKLYQARNYQSTRTCFGDFVDLFYKQKNECKAIGSPLSHAYKLIMNSLYGKFA